MYSQFFGFDKLPFRLRPDPDFVFPGREYLRARTGLSEALRGDSRVVLFMGPPGVGKTLLLDEVLKELEPQFAVCRVNQPHISAAELLQALKLQLSVALEEVPPSLEFAGKRPPPALLIIDDAQLLPTETLRLFPKILSKMRLKILLVARQYAAGRGPDLPARLNLGEQPRNIAMQALTAEGVRAYIEHRLRVAGGAQDLFSQDAFSVIHQHTAGSPRLVNVLCDAALNAACLCAAGHVSGSEIVLAGQDARWSEALARDRAAPAIDECIHADNIVALAPESSSPQSLSAAQFLVRYRNTPVRSWPLQAGRMSIGRADDNSLRLEAPDVSRHHCEVVTSGSVSVIEDLGSVNGIIVNGKAVKRHVLQHADIVTLGEHVLKYWVGA